jgi:ROS/MUCR transcriptional regulator protein
VVPVRRSLTPNHLVCLVCGKQLRMLRRHLATEHGLTPGQYREAFGLKSDYPMTASNYSRQRSELAKQHGLGRPKKKPPQAEGLPLKHSPSADEEMRLSSSGKSAQLCPIILDAVGSRYTSEIGSPLRTTPSTSTAA